MNRLTLHPGSRRRKAWRLKKKYEKWFSIQLRELIRDTLKELPQNLLENAFSGIDYTL